MTFSAASGKSLHSSGFLLPLLSSLHLSEQCLLEAQKYRWACITCLEQRSPDFIWGLSYCSTEEWTHSHLCVSHKVLWYQNEVAFNEETMLSYSQCQGRMRDKLHLFTRYTFHFMSINHIAGNKGARSMSGVPRDSSSSRTCSPWTCFSTLQ